MLRAVRALPLGNLTKQLASDPVIGTTLISDSTAAITSSYLSHLAEHAPYHATAHLVQTSLPPIPIQPGLPLWELPSLVPEWIPRVIQSVTDIGAPLLHIGVDIASCLHALTIALPIMRLINYYMSSEHYHEHASDIKRHGKVELMAIRDWSNVCAEYQERHAIRQILGFSKPLPIGLPTHVNKLLELANSVGSMQGTAPSLHTALSNEINSMHRRLQERSEVPVPDNSQRGFEKLLAEFAPEFNFRRYTMSQPHPECAIARKIALAVVANETKRSSSRNVMVGGSPYQCSAFPDMVHNCAPILSGRDEFRHRHTHSYEERAFAESISCRNVFQACDKVTPGCNLIVPMVPDLSASQLVRGMVHKGINNAFVITHLPIPLLDSRISTWFDDELAVRFEREKGRIGMYHLNSAGAGYFNDEEAMLSWARPAPVVPGLDITIEELRHIGSLYVLQVKIGVGKGEDKPSLFKVASGRFYVLPILKNRVRMGKDERTHFVVPAVRFDNITKFAAISTTARNAFEVVGNKVRGQEAEIKVADKIILARWELSSDEFNSTVTHAVIRAEIMRRDNSMFTKKGLDYVAKWYGRTSGGFLKRYLTHLLDTVTLSSLHRPRGMFEDSLWEDAMSYVFNSRLNDHAMEDPYAEFGIYRLQHDQSRGNRLIWLVGRDESTFSVVSREACVYTNITGLERIEYFDHVNTSRQTNRHVSKKDMAMLELLALWEGTGPVPVQTVDEDGSGWSDCELEEPVTQEAEAQTEDESRANWSPQFFPNCPGEVKRSCDPEIPECSTGTASPDDKPASRPEGLSQDPPESVVSGEPASETPSSEVELTPSVSSKDSIAAIPGLDQPCAVYQVSQHQLDISRQCCGSIDFGGEISYHDGASPTPSQIEFSGRFQSDTDVKNAVESEEFREEPIPDTGAVKYLELVLSHAKTTVGSCNFNPEDELIPRDMSGDEDDKLKEHVNVFWNEIKTSFNRRGDRYVRPHLLIDGLAASAKSDISRQVIGMKSALVVVPTKELRRHWRSEARGQNVTVITQHHLPSGTDRYDFLVLDEANCYSKNQIKAWLHLAHRHKVRRVLCLADTFQKDKRKETDAQFGHSPLLAPSVRMTHTFGMPLDALCTFLLCNGLENDRRFYTLSKVRRSIYLFDRSVSDPADFPRQDLYTRARVTAATIKDPHGNEICSVTQSQGLRCREHYFTSGLNNKQHRWFRNMPAVQSVLFSRHTQRLVLDMNLGNAADAFPKVQFEHVQVINGDKTNAQLAKERYRRPYDMDTTFVPYASTNEMFLHPAWPMDAAASTGERMVTVNKNPDVPQLDQATGISYITSMKMANEVINPKVQHTSRREYKESLDFVTEAAHGLISCSMEVGFGDEPRLKSHIPGVTALGDIQMARDRYNDLRNVIIRQLNEPKHLYLTMQDVSDAKEIFDSYVQSFCGEEYEVHAVNNFGYDYISSRSPTFVKTWNDPFGYAASTVSRSSFLKTQVKVKPGLNGQETHGQTIIANEASMTNFFGPYARLAYYGMAQMDREDFITDVGLSDDELSMKLKEKGIGARIEAFGNLQIDLTRQDSTHRPAHVLAYAMFLEFCGVPTEVCDLYVMMRSMAYIKSLAEGLYKAFIKWNLGSGDPFTLNANCFMMKGTMAVRYNGLKYCAGIQKGDDFICSNEGWKVSMRAGLYSRLKVTMKIDVNKPPYHAGRFIVEGQVLADPVRAFFRHFAKTHDPKCTLEEIFVSFNDRKIHYTERQAEWLKATIPLFYPDVNAEEAIYVVDVILSLRSFKVFASTYKYADRCENDIYDPNEDCAFLVARRLKPSLASSTLRQFRNHVNPVELLGAYQRAGIDSMLAAHPSLVPRGFVGAVITARHVYAILPTTPTF